MQRNIFEHPRAYDLHLPEVHELALLLAHGLRCLHHGRVVTLEQSMSDELNCYQKSKLAYLGLHLVCILMLEEYE